MAPTDPDRRRRAIWGFAVLAGLLAGLGIWWDGGTARDLRQSLPVALAIGAGLGWVAVRVLQRADRPVAGMLLGAGLALAGLAAYAILFPLAHLAVEALRGAVGDSPGWRAALAGGADSLRRSASGAARLVLPAALGGAAIGWVSRPADRRQG